MDLKKFIYTDSAYNVNLAEFIDAEKLHAIGDRAKRGFSADRDSCDEWDRRTKPAMDLAMLIHHDKSYPFEGAANVKFPLLTIASLQFHARAYPAIVAGNRVVKGKVIGKDVIYDPDGNPIPGAKSKVADRVSTHMSYQLLEELEEWEPELDRALVTLPIVGEEWKKTYYCPVSGRIKSCRVSSKNIVINYKAKTPDVCPRISEIVPLYPNEVVSFQRQGVFLDDEDLKTWNDADFEDDDDAGYTDDEDAPVIFVEQHTWEDLDDDGYKEPYVVTFHKSSGKVVRIFPRFRPNGVIYNTEGEVAKITPIQYYTQTVFFPSPDGGSRGMGFGNLLGPVNEVVNTLANQILDSGTLYNSNSGFIARGALPNRGNSAGNLQFQLGEWKVVNKTGDDLRKDMVPLQVHEPSTVLFSLMGLVLDYGNRLSSVSEVMAGENPGANVPAASVMALIEQGMKIFTGVYKRIHRSLKQEFKKIFALNAEYLPQEQYFRIMDDELAISRLDYNVEGVDILPVSDPNDVLDTVKRIKAELLGQKLGTGYNDQEIRRRYLEAYSIEDPEKLLLSDEQLSAPSHDQMMDQAKMELENKKFELDAVKTQFEIMKLYGMAMKAMSEAELNANAGEIETYKAQLKALSDQSVALINKEAVQAKAAKKEDTRND